MRTISHLTILVFVIMVVRNLFLETDGFHSCDCIAAFLNKVDAPVYQITVHTMYHWRCTKFWGFMFWACFDAIVIAWGFYWGIYWLKNVRWYECNLTIFINFHYANYLSLNHSLFYLLFLNVFLTNLTLLKHQSSI